MDTENFKHVLNNFLTDINRSFPEFRLFDKEIYKNLEDDNCINIIIDKCKSIYPKHFFDILYQNNDLFNNNIELLPEINFKVIWKANISNETRKIIWQYLQLILFNLIKDINSIEELGDTAKLFEFIDNDDFKEKLSETFEKFSVLFNGNKDSNKCNDLSNNPFLDLSNNPFLDLSNNPFLDLSNNNFNVNDIHEHLFKLLNGNIGKLAKELAEDSLEDLLEDISLNSENMCETKDVFEKLVKNPNKLFNLVKKISSKLEKKIESGEINKDELVNEASNLFKNMKNMPGMEDMLKKVAKQHGGKMPSMDSVESKLGAKLRESQQRKRMLEKLNKKRIEKIENDKKSEEEVIVENKEDKKVNSEEDIMMSFIENKSVNKSKKKKKKNK